MVRVRRLFLAVTLTLPGGGALGVCRRPRVRLNPEKKSNGRTELVGFVMDQMVRFEASQVKAKEVEFFDNVAATDDYDVFQPQAKERIIDAFVRVAGLAAGARVLDIGCGSGTFTRLLQLRGYRLSGIDISSKMIAMARQKSANIQFYEGDAENLPFENGAFDAVLLSGLVHHFPDQHRLAAEAFRVLTPGGKFVAFDPNRMNPFMWLYRDPSSPFYSQVGVTENERPILAWQTADVFRNAGFLVKSDYLAGLAYRYVASSRTQLFLPVYNFIDRAIFNLPFMKRFRPFVLSSGEKPRQDS
jgi:ubiquinone/menaquinone biosynthesis C-methylase UbiE